MRGRKFQRTTLMAVAVAACCLTLGPSLSARADEDDTPTTLKPTAESSAPAALSQGKLAPVPAPADYAPPPYPIPGGYNYYVQPGEAGPLGAQLYVSPRPTPPLVGHTLITYPPLAPHEFLYHHHRVYHTENPGSGVTKTRVHWR